MKTLFLVMLFPLLFPLAAVAHGGAEHPAGADHAQIPAGTQPATSAPRPVLKDTMAALDAALVAGNLTPVHELTEQAAAAARATPSSADQNGKRLDAGVKQFIARLAALHSASGTGDQALAAAEYKKVQSAYRLLEAQLDNQTPLTSKE